MSLLTNPFTEAKRTSPNIPKVGLNVYACLFNKGGIEANGWWEIGRGRVSRRVVETDKSIHHMHLRWYIS